jgi:hypothetical protein
VEDNKVTIELNLESKEFEVKLGNVRQEFGKLGNEGKGHVEGLGMQFLFLNEALEVGEKLLHGFEAAISQISAYEKINNQTTALKNLGAVIGADTEQIVQGIVKLTGGTVTGVQATQMAFELLKSGVKAEAIPAIIEWAEKVDKASGGQKKLEDAIHAVSFAVETGQSRSLKQYGIELDAVGTRQQVLNSILKQTEQQSKSLGDGYTEFGEKLETSMKNTFNTITKGFGKMLTETALVFMGDEVDKNSSKVKFLEGQIKMATERIKEYGEQSNTVYKFDGETTARNLTALELKKKLEEELLKAKGDLHKAVEEEHKDHEETAKNFTQERELKKNLTDEEKKMIELRSNVIALDKLSAQEEAETGEINLKNNQELTAAKKALVLSEFADRKRLIASTAKDEKEYQTQLVEMEIEKNKRLRALRVDDFNFNKSLQAAQMNAVMSNIMAADNAQSRHHAIQEQQENQRNQREIERLRSSGMAKAQFDKRMEQEEVAHQRNLSNIKNQYEKINTQNLQFGLNNALTSMRGQFGSFSNFVTSATNKTHSIMSKGFVDLAKGHGDAMQKMTAQFVESIGTQMIEAGVFHLLMGIWPPNPVELGQGAALIAAGSAIVGASASIGGGQDSGGGSVGSMSPETAPPSAPPTAPGQAQPAQMDKKQASIIIQGDFLNSRETANHLSEILRQNSDITDYTITAQGRNYG